MPIFVVDDDADVLHATRFLLEGEGYSVATFACGRQLLAAFPDAKPCCMVIDYLLPDMTGLDVYHQLRMRGVSTPTIIITGHPSLAIREKVSKAGLPLVEKTSVEDLLEAIESTDSPH